MAVWPFMFIMSELVSRSKYLYYSNNDDWEIFTVLRVFMFSSIDAYDLRGGWGSDDAYVLL